MKADDIRHSIGNPLFALETNLVSLRRLLPDDLENRTAVEIADTIQIQIERIKLVLERLDDDN